MKRPGNPMRTTHTCSLLREKELSESIKRREEGNQRCLVVLLLGNEGQSCLKLVEELCLIERNEKLSSHRIQER